MVSLNDLALIASAFNHEPLYHGIRRAVRDEDWRVGNGCRFADLAHNSAADQVCGSRFPVNEITIELLEVTGEIVPHMHEDSDSVALALPFFGDSPEFWYAFDARWHRFGVGQLFVIPRGVGHGFRLGDRQVHPFHLLVVTNPPIADGDVLAC